MWTSPASAGCRSARRVSSGTIDTLRVSTAGVVEAEAVLPAGVALCATGDVPSLPSSAQAARPTIAAPPPITPRNRLRLTLATGGSVFVVDIWIPLIWLGGLQVRVVFAGAGAGDLLVRVEKATYVHLTRLQVEGTRAEVPGRSGIIVVRLVSSGRRNLRCIAWPTASSTTSSGCSTRTPPSTACPFDTRPEVRRRSTVMSDGRRISSLVWGSGPPDVVLIHGGAQNAHTWDTVALALGCPLLAPDLPGHGHSDSPAAGVGTSPAANAADLAEVIESLATDAGLIVGMSLGGLSAIVLATARPDLVRRLLLVDITPGVTGEKAKAIHDFVRGPATFPSFDELLARTMEFNPTRSESSLRRGILHNATQLDDGSWVWRHRRDDSAVMGDDSAPRAEPALLWDDLELFAGPITLVRGTRAQSVVDDADVAELLRRRPDAVVIEVDAGHSVQGDAPLELAEIIRAAMTT